MIPGASTARLNTAFAAGVASLIVVPGTNHNTIGESPLYLASIQKAIGTR